MQKPEKFLCFLIAAGKKVEAKSQNCVKIFIFIL